MVASESVSDPLKEHDDLVSGLANLEKKFAEGKLQQNEFEVLSKQLKERISRAEQQAYGAARKNESIAKRLRLRNYNDPEVQQVISHFLRFPGRPLEPEFGTDRVPRYPVETEDGRGFSAEMSVLERMGDIGMVKKTLYERVVSCPRCAAPRDVFLRFKCTQCGSIEISIGRMIEHLQCGTIHQESAFQVGKNLICPTCKKLLQSKDEYRLIGVVCSCNACRAQFEDPVEGFYCRKCKVDFDLPTGNVVDVHSYTMIPTALSEARRFLGVNVLTQTLREAGFEVNSPGLIPGTTKETMFSLLAKKDGRQFAIDLSQSDTEVDVEPVLELYVKLLEANFKAAIFGAVPRLSKRARDVASLHSILIAEAATPSEVGKKILDIIVNL